MDEVQFGLVVELAPGGRVIGTWKHETKYKARGAAHDMAKEKPGSLFVVMDTDQAYRSEPVVRTVYLAYPTQKAEIPEPMAVACKELEDMPI